jgi:aspartate oxidase
MATEERTVLVSSHQMGEGRLLVDSETEAFQRDHEPDREMTPLGRAAAGLGGAARWPGAKA